jgi:kynurenine formamidase
MRLAREGSSPFPTSTASNRNRETRSCFTPVGDAEAYLSGEPGPGCDVAQWLIDHGVALTGCDTWSYGPVPAEDPARPFEVPQMLNVHHGVFVVENLDTSELAADGVRKFALVLTHPKLRGATGAWTSPIALV